MADASPIEVHGPNRLIADIINGVIGDVGEGGRQVTVLVDPEPEHWQTVRDRTVVAVLSDPTDADILRAIRRGADAVIDAQSVLSELPRAVAIVRAGGVALTSMHGRLVVDALRREAKEPQISLTRRETDIVQSIILGDSVKQTALRLGIAQKTVENLQRRMFRKLDVRNRAQAVARVHDLGLLEIDLTRTEATSPATCGASNPRRGDSTPRDSYGWVRASWSPIRARSCERSWCDASRDRSSGRCRSSARCSRRRHCAASLGPTRPLFVDEYRRNRTTGSFILVDEATFATVASAMIHSVERPAKEPKPRPIGVWSTRSTAARSSR